MGKVTIVSNELKEEKVKYLQEEADRLINDHNYTPHQIMHHFGLAEGLSISIVYPGDGKIIMNCENVPKITKR